jgi:hypothetical protein
VISEIGLGFISGVASGMLGIGGAIVLVPGMVLFYGMGQHVAQGTSLITVALISLWGGFIHHRQQTAELGLALKLIPFACAFALTGGYLADLIPGAALQRIFGLVLIIIGGRMVIGHDSQAS